MACRRGQSSPVMYFLKLQFALGFLVVLCLSTHLQAQVIQHTGVLFGTGAISGNYTQGSSVDISEDGTTAVVGSSGDMGGVGAVYIYVFSGGTWSQQGEKLVGDWTLGSFPEQGRSVAISADGNTVAVGGPEENGKGAVWIFTRSGNTWSQQTKLNGTTGPGRMLHGISVDISADGNTVIAGEPLNGRGGAWIYTRSGNTWSRSTWLTGTGGTSPLVPQGDAVALSADGNTAVITSFADNGNQGALWVFTRSGNAWTQQGSKITGTGIAGNSPSMGSSVGISGDGNTIIAGGIGDAAQSNASMYAIWIFARSGNAWNQQTSTLIGNSFLRATIGPQKGDAVKLSGDGNTAIAAVPQDDVHKGTVLIFTRSGTSWSQQGSKLMITDTSLGGAVGISGNGNRIIAGGSDYHQQGSVWILTRPGSSWNQPGTKLVGAGATGMVEQGSAMALSGDGQTVILGARKDDFGKGAVWIFARSGTNWSQQGSKLVGTGMVGLSAQGYSVAISSDGNTAAIGGPSDNNHQGAVWVFIRTGTSWSQQGTKLTGTGAAGAARQGSSVAVSADGNTLVIGGESDNNNQGAAWIFTRSGNTWSQAGNKLTGTGATGSAGQGNAVGISADANTIVLGGSQDNGGQGAVWIFTRSGNTWSQQGSKLVGTGAVGAARQGSSVAVSANGNTIAAGGAEDNSDAGATWIFTRSGTSWEQQGSKLVGTGARFVAKQGSALGISASGNTLLVGGPATRDGAIFGAAWLFTRSGNAWSQLGSKLYATGAIENSELGSSVGISAEGNTIVIGAMGNRNKVGGFWAFTVSSCSGNPVAGTLPSTTGVCPGNAATITAGGTTTDAGIIYQWEESDDNGPGDAWSNATGGSGANTISYTTPNTLTASRYYRLRITCSFSGASSNTNPVQVLINQAPAITTPPAAQTACAGDNATFTVAATGSGLSYQWQVSTDNGVTFTPLSAPLLPSLTLNALTTSMHNYQYRVIVTNSCMLTVTAPAVVLSVVPKPGVPVVTQNGNVLQSSAATGNQWFLNGVALAGATGQFYEATQSGNYTVTATNAQGCAVSSAAFALMVTGIDDAAFSGSIKVYPNPSEHRFSIKIESETKGEVKVTVTDALGRRVCETQMKVNRLHPETEINLEGQPNGMYLLKIEANGKTAIKKLVKRTL